MIIKIDLGTAVFWVAMVRLVGLSN